MISERGLGKGIGMGSRKMVSTGSREGYRNGISGGISGWVSEWCLGRGLGSCMSRGRGLVKGTRVICLTM
jgi:hypothetical protein